MADNPDSHGRLNWAELQIFANIIAAFFEEKGRDPIGQEYNRIVANVHTIHELARISGAAVPVDPPSWA